MKGTKEQKGITLIALIITIVVLLILAAVAISSISNDGILHYAQNAADSWNKAQTNEQTMMDSYLAYLNNLNHQQCTAHTYVDGVCSNCGYPCQHDWEETDEYSEEVDWAFAFMCSNCGLKCEHHYSNCGSTEYYYVDETYCANDYYCKTCGFVFFTQDQMVEHEYNEEGICIYGGHPCYHEFDYNLTCEKCGYECEGPFNDEGVCTVCGAECPHPGWTVTDARVVPGTGEWHYGEWIHYAYFTQLCYRCNKVLDSDYYDYMSCTFDSNGKCTSCGQTN